MSSYDQGYQHVLYHAGLSNEKTAAFWSRALGAAKNFFGNTTSRIGNSFGSLGGAPRQAYTSSRDMLQARVGNLKNNLSTATAGTKQHANWTRRLDKATNELGDLKWNRFKQVAPAYATMGAGLTAAGGAGYALAPDPQPWYKEMVQNPMGR